MAIDAPPTARRASLCTSSRSSKSRRRCSRTLLRLAALVGAAPLVLYKSILPVHHTFTGFTSSPLTHSGLNGGSVRPLRAEAEEKSETVALVKVDDTSIQTTAGLLVGITGLLLGGVWLGGAAFVAGSYLAKQENNDVGVSLNGISKGVLESLNFGSYINERYELSTKLSSTVSKAVDSNIKEKDKAGITKLGEQFASAVENLDKEVSIKQTLGSLAVGASDIASTVVTKALAYNEENKVLEKLGEKASELAQKTKKQ